MKIILLIASFFLPSTKGMASDRKYTPDWESLDSRPLPGWYDDAKIGIFMHFGPYAVPGKLMKFGKERELSKHLLFHHIGYGSEWFWTNWNNSVEGYVNFMKNYYPPKFTYQDFGAQLTMEFFNASTFADIIAASGAKLVS